MSSECGRASLGPDSQGALRPTHPVPPDALHFDGCCELLPQRCDLRRLVQVQGGAWIGEHAS